MDNQTNSLSQNLARNIINLRKKQGFSQLQLAKKSTIPRSTLTYFESGSSNPSLHNLAKLSTALGVSVEELLSPPQFVFRHILAKEIPIEKKGKNKIQVEKLLPDPIPGMEIDKMSFAPLSRFKGTPHITNTREYLYCLDGLIKVYVKKNQFTLKKGDLLVFPGDEAHAYENPSSSKIAKGFSVVVFAPMGL